MVTTCTRQSTHLQDEVQRVASSRSESEDGVGGLNVQHLVVLTGVLPGEGVEEGGRETGRDLGLQVVRCTGGEPLQVNN